MVDSSREKIGNAVEGGRGLGRPRAFNREAALEASMRVFWKHGYEGASLTLLTGAMGINRPSLYAAYGDKAALFREALEVYSRGPGRYVRRALGKIASRDVVETLLRGAVALATDPSNPGGCLWVQGALVASAGGASIRGEMISVRGSGIARVRERLDRAQKEGDLPAGADVETLTHFVISLMHGISVEAASGAGRERLDKVVDLALSVWPPREERRS